MRNPAQYPACSILMRPLAAWLLPLFLAAALPAAAQPTGIALPDVVGMVGDRVSTDLTLTDAPGITGITLEILFDATMVAPDETITMGPFGESINNFSGANVVGSDTLRVAVAVIDDPTGYVGSGVLLTIHWDLIGAGTSPLEFVSVLLENNQSPPPLPAEATDGSIDVEPAPVEGASWGGVKARYEGDAIEP